MNRLARIGLTVSAVAMALGTITTANAVSPKDLQQSDTPREVTISMGTINGSGCNRNNTQAYLSSDRKVLNTTFSGYVVKSGKGISQSEARKNCQISLTVNVPNGYTYAVAKADYRGYARIADGARGQQSATYYYSGDSSTMHTYSPFEGGFDGDFTFTDEKDMEDYVWAPCGTKRNLNIKTDLRLDKGSSNDQSYMSMDSTDVSIATLLNLVYKRC